MIFDVINAIDQIAEPLGQIMHSQVFDETFGIGWKALGKRDFLLESHLENFVGVAVHERWLANEHFIDHNA